MLESLLVILLKKIKEHYKELTPKLKQASKSILNNLNQIPFQNKNAIYFYCVSNYPTDLSEINMPDFKNSFFKGYSDHTIGLSACQYAISKGANFIEKHFTTNKALAIQKSSIH